MVLINYLTRKCFSQPQNLLQATKYVVQSSKWLYNGKYSPAFLQVKLRLLSFHFYADGGWGLLSCAWAVDLIIFCHMGISELKMWLMLWFFKHCCHFCYVGYARNDKASEISYFRFHPQSWITPDCVNNILLCIYYQPGPGKTNASILSFSNFRDIRVRTLTLVQSLDKIAWICYPRS